LTCQNTTWYGIVIKDSQRRVRTTTATHLRAETKWIRGIDSLKKEHQNHYKLEIYTILKLKLMSDWKLKFPNYLIFKLALSQFIIVFLPSFYTTTTQTTTE
jgi:hypothetical protein